MYQQIFIYINIYTNKQANKRHRDESLYCNDKINQLYKLNNCNGIFFSCEKKK